MPLQKNLFKIVQSPYSQIIFVTILGALLRFYNIGLQPLWIDEAFSFRFSQFPLSQLWGAEAVNEPNPPLYYTLLKIWIFLFGDSEIALRSLPAFFGVLTIPLLYFIGRTLGDHKLGIIAATLLAFSPINIQYSQETRAYTLLTVSVTLAILGLAKLSQNPEGSKVPIGKVLIQDLFSKDSAKIKNQVNLDIYIAWFSYVFGLCLAFYAHSTAVFLILITNIFALIYWINSLSFNKIFVKNWIVVNTFILVIWAWWLTVVLRQTGANSWIPFTTFTDSLSVLSSVLIEPSREQDYVLQIFKYTLFLCLLILGLWKWRNNLKIFTLVNLFLIGFPFLCFIVSFSRPLFIPRVFLWTTVPFYLLIASGISAFRSRFISIFLLTIILTFQIRGTLNYYETFKKEPWNQVANYIASHSKQGDTIIMLSTYFSVPFNYYFRKSSINLNQYGLVKDYSDKKYSELNQVSELKLGDINTATSSSNHVFFIRGHMSHSSEFKDISLSVTSTLSEHMNQVDHFNKELEVLTFESSVKSL